MFQYLIVLFVVIGNAAAKPGLVGAPLAYTVPAAPAPVVTATSSQVVARTYNGVAHAPVLAPAAAPVVAATPLAAPLTAGVAPAFSPALSPAYARYAASPFLANYAAPVASGPFAYTAPFASRFYPAAAAVAPAAVPARLTYAPSYAASPYFI